MKNADINIKNNEGLKPKDLATDQAVKKQSKYSFVNYYVHNT